MTVLSLLAIVLLSGLQSTAPQSAPVQNAPGQSTSTPTQTDPPPNVTMLPNSCSPAAQAPFQTGLLALHNFEYEEAAQFFETTQKLDSRCAIAGWGLAMTYWHPLWAPPTADDIKKGRAAAAWADERMAKTTPREQHYIAAIRRFWEAENTPADTLAAAKIYADRMKTLHEHFPNDTEATLFYALALIATEDGTLDQRQAQAKQAGALIEPILLKEPWNPGAAHYLIHAYDTPQLAPAALRAARVYAKLAPDSPHALHMPSHIFAQIGFWQEMVNSNEASFAAARNSTGPQAEKVHEVLHALDYLQYAYLQLGKFDDARRVTALSLEISKENPTIHSSYNRYGVVWRYPVEVADWATIAKETPPDPQDGLYWPAEYAWLQVMAAGNLHDAARAKEWLPKFESAAQAAMSGARGDEAKMLPVLQQEAEGWAALAQGDNAGAVQHMRAAVQAEAVPGAYGDFRKPANEMLGDVLLAQGDKAGALAAYRASLQDHKGRRLSMEGVKAASITAPAVTPPAQQK